MLIVGACWSLFVVCCLLCRCFCGVVVLLIGVCCVLVVVRCSFVCVCFVLFVVCGW